MPIRSCARFTLFLGCFLLVLAGCAHLSDLQRDHARGLGTSATYAVSSDDAWKIALQILRNAGAESIEEHRDAGYMVTSTAMGEGLSAGTYIGVWIAPDGTQTNVSVLTKRRSSFEVVTALTERGFHKQFWAALSSSGHPDDSGSVAPPTAAPESPPSQAAPMAPSGSAGEVTKDQCIDANAKAQSLRRSGKLGAARGQLAVCIDARCPGVVRDDCTQRLDELEHVQPTIVFDAKDGAGNDLIDVRVTMDGKPLVGKLDGSAVAVDPGAHAFSFQVKGQPTVTKSFVLKEGEKLRRERVVIGPRS